MLTKCHRRFFNSCSVLLRDAPVSLKGHKKSSQEWLRRQMRDPYVEKSKLENYRSRSAFKLIEIDDKYKFLKPGCTVLDCGAAPGGWTQVAARRCNADKNDTEADVGTVIGIDVLRIHPIPGATLLSLLDFTNPTSKEKLREVLDGRLVDVFLSDMAPNATGISALDHEGIVELVFQALRFALETTKPGGVFLAKIWNGDQAPTLVTNLERFYENVQIIKPPASRKESAEIYLFSRNFRGLKKTS